MSKVQQTAKRWGETTESQEDWLENGWDMEKSELKAILQALIFVADEPLTIDQLREVFPDEEVALLKESMEEMTGEFNELHRGMEIREIAGGYRIATRPEHHEWVRRYLRTKPSAKLSLAALETLAVIAYKQPVTIPEILDIRGVKSSSSIRTLLEKKLIETRGRKKVVGRPILYGTSKDFLVHFGLKDLSELPTLEEFEELLHTETGSAAEIRPPAGSNGDFIEQDPD